MKPQWWVNCKPLADEAMKVCVESSAYSIRTRFIYLLASHSLENTRRRA